MIILSNFSVEEISDLFIVSQAEGILNKSGINSCGKEGYIYDEVDTKVRKATENISEIKIEDSISQIEKEQLKRLKNKNTKLMLDE